MTANFTALLGADTRAAHDRMTLLCAMGSLGRDVADDVLIDRMARVAPAWTWEAVGHCCADLADGGALERLRDGRGFVVGWRITDDAARWLLTATLCAVASAPDERARVPSWLLALPSIPKPTTSSMTKVVTP